MKIYQEKALKATVGNPRNRKSAIPFFQCTLYSLWVQKKIIINGKIVSKYFYEIEAGWLRL